MKKEAAALRFPPQEPTTSFLSKYFFATTKLRHFQMKVQTELLHFL